MANTASAKKQARASAKRTVRNRGVRSAVKTRVVRVRRALAEGASEGLVELVTTAISSLDRAAAKGILHKNNAGRRKSRLMRRMNQLEAAPAASEATTKPQAGRSATAAKPGRATAAKGAQPKASSSKTTTGAAKGGQTTGRKTVAKPTSARKKS